MVGRLYTDTVTFAPPEAEPWMARSACADTDPDLFFPKKKENYGKAKKVCGGCDVRLQCLAFTLSREVGSRRYGIAGGLSARERWELQQMLDKREKVSNG
jgi:WhiB family redox-sensing transcriptional regulator